MQSNRIMQGDVLQEKLFKQKLNIRMIQKELDSWEPVWNQKSEKDLKADEEGDGD